MSYHVNIVRLKAVANALQEWKDKVVFVGGATVSLYASKPQAASIRNTDDVDVVVELISTAAFHKMQDRLLELGFKNDMDSHIISRFLYQGLVVDFIPVDPKVLGFTNKWYEDGVKHAEQRVVNNVTIKIFTSPYFIASKMEAFKSRGENDVYSSHDLEDIIFVLDNRDSIAEELSLAEINVKDYLRKEFKTLLSNAKFIDALTGLVEPNNQTARKERVLKLMEQFVKE